MIKNPFQSLVQSLALKEKVEALSGQQKILLFVITLVVLVGGFYFFQYKDLSRNIDRLKGQVTQKERDLARLKSAAQQVAVLEERLAHSEEEFSRLLTLLPDQREIPGFLESVSKLGAEVGLENILFQPQSERVEGFYAAIPVKLDLVGTYHELGIFLDRVSKLDRILRVQNLNISRQRNEGLLQVGCTIETYRFLDNPVEPPPASTQRRSR